MVVEKKASAQNTAAGAALIFKICFVFISFSLCCFAVRVNRAAHMGRWGSLRHRHKENVKKPCSAEQHSKGSALSGCCIPHAFSMHGVVMRTSYDDPLEIDPEFDRRGCRHVHVRYCRKLCAVCPGQTAIFASGGGPVLDSPYRFPTGFFARSITLLFRGFG